MNESKVPYWPGAKGTEMIAKMVSAMMDPEQDHRVCLFCAARDRPGLVGVAEFVGEQAALMGARPGKSRAAVYFVCIECASTHPTQQSLDDACDAKLLQSIVALEKETPQ